MRHSLAITLILSLTFANGAQGQLQESPDFRSLTLQPHKRAGDSVTKVLSKAEQRKRFDDRTSRVRSHMRPIPIKKSAKPFAVNRGTDAAEVRAKSAEAQLSSRMSIMRQTSVTASAKIDYHNASDVSEPSVAVRGQEVLVTGNWYSAFSKDGGQSFKALDPYETFGSPTPGGGFCCDQLAIFDARSDTMFWLMQGINDNEGNSLRLAYATGATEIQNLDWTVLDLPSTGLVGKPGFWMDFPDIAISDQHVFVTTNVFTTDERQKFSGSLAIRISKSALLTKGAMVTLAAQRFEEGTLRLAHGATTTQYWVAHESDSQVKAWQWRAGDDKPGRATLIDVERWEEPSLANTSNSAGPKKQSWLTRADGRMATAWLSGNVLGFAWTAGADNRFKYAHVRQAIVSTGKLTGTGVGESISPDTEPHVWSSLFAIAYPAMAPNAIGQVGMLVAFGGPRYFPGFAVGVLEAPWKTPPILTRGRTGVNGPNCPRGRAPKDCGQWGDYFSVRPHGTDSKTWVTVGYTLQNSPNGNESLKAESEFVWFTKR